MRDDKTWLLDMLIAARNVAEFVQPLSEAEFKASKLHHSAVAREILVIGEASRQLSDKFKASHPEIDWTDILGMRNRLVHEYFRMDLHLMWSTSQHDIPKLITQLEPFVEAESDRSESDK
jgi:uncharacterized protein with HEPN domain